MAEEWKVGYKFDPKTGVKRPWEGWNRVYVNGKLVTTVRWGSYTTEEAAIKGLTKKVEQTNADPIFTHDGRTIEFVGNMGA